MGKTLMGITFHQLHENTVEELNRVQAAIYSDSLREVLEAEGFDGQDGRLKDFLEMTTERISNMLGTTFNKEYYEGLRQVYDTENRFALAALLMEKTQVLGPLISDLMDEILSDFEKGGF